MNVSERWNYISVNENGEMAIENLNASKIVEQYGCPVYTLSENKIVQNFQKFRNAFSNYPKVSVHYACKCNSNLEVLEILRDQGAGLDTSSMGEIIAGLVIGLDNMEISYTSGYKSDKDIEFAIRNDIRYISIDSFEEITKIDLIAEKMNSKMRVILRINPEIETPNYSTMENKFGVRFSEAKEAVEKILASPGLTLTGFHFHGGYIYDMGIYLSAANRVLDLVKYLKDKGIEIKNLDFGGGYPQEDGRHPEFDITVFGNRFTKYLIEKLTELNYTEMPTLVLEPGKFIVSNTGVLLVQVGAIKTMPNGKKIAITNGSTYGHIPDVLVCNWKYDIFSASNVNADEKESYEVGGCLCDPIDIMSKECLLPKLKEGDILAVMDTGAYTNVISSNFNTMPKAPIVILNNRKIRLARRREKYSEVFLTELQKGEIKKLTSSINEYSSL